MTDESHNRINAAVRECLARCYDSDERPVYEVATYLEELRRGGDWTEAEVTTVRATVARLLR